MIWIPKLWIQLAQFFEDLPRTDFLAEEVLIQGDI